MAELALSPETLEALETIFKNGYWWITPVAVVVSAFLSYRAARRTVHETVASNRKNQREKATLDLIASREVDSDFISAKKRFNTQRDTKAGFTGFVRSELPLDVKESVRLIINDYELIAVGIETGILDRDFYEKWFKTAFLSDYKALHNYIADVRLIAKSDSIYSQMEALAVHWGADPVKKTQVFSDEMWPIPTTDIMRESDPPG